MKKYIIRLVILVVSVFLVGCSIYKLNSEEKTEPVSLKIWSDAEYLEENMKKLVADFNDTLGKSDGISLEYQTFGNEYFSVLATAYASDNMPEIILLSSYHLNTVADKGWLYPIENIKGGKRFLLDYEYDQDNSYVYNNRIYALPFSSVSYKLAYNRDLFIKHGLTDDYGEPLVPKEWDEVVDYAKRITDGESYGVVFPMKNADDFWERELIGAFYDSCGDHEEYNEGCLSIYERALNDYFLKIKKDKSYYPNPERLDNNNALSLFAMGKIGMKVVTFSDMVLLNKKYPVSSDWDVVDLPVFDAEQVDMPQGTVCHGEFFCMTSAVGKLLDETKALKVYSWLYGDEVKSGLYNDGVYFDKTEEHFSAEMIGSDVFYQPENVVKREFFENLFSLNAEQRIGDFFNEIWFSDRTTVSVDKLSDMK